MIRKVLTLAAAVAAFGAISASAGDFAEAKPKGFHKHGHFHKWHGHRFHKRFHGYGYVHNYGCYWKWTHYGKVKVCPYSYY